MLNPNNDRLDYGQILTPPSGYYTDFAIGTTYSLNLDALVGASLALGLSAETDSELLNNPVCLLEALRIASENVALFCEGGQIHKPNRPTPLYILLEKMVYSVKARPAKKRPPFPSFHPKMWLIRYINEYEEALYRIIVMSRNLTFDRSWDVVFYMDGLVWGNKRNKNQPLCDFLRYLREQIPSNSNGKVKRRRINSIIEELPYVNFKASEDGKVFKDYEFLPVGIKNEYGEFYGMEDTPLFSDSFQELFIMSPFVNGSVIRRFNDKNGLKDTKHMLITRAISLNYLEPKDVSNFKLYTMRDTVIDGEDAISDGATVPQKQDIHAKVYMWRKYSDADLYVGSLNATSKALNGNIEFMIRLKSKNRHLNIDSLTKSLFGNDKDGKDNPFQEVKLSDAIVDEDVEKSYAMDAVVKSIFRNDPRATVTEADGLFNLDVFFGKCDIDGFVVDVRPMLSRKTAAFDENIQFEKLDIAQLSEFYVVTVSDDEKSIERVLMIPTEGIPEDREKTVITRVVSDKECFCRYIAFLLGDDEIISALEVNDTVNSMNSSKTNMTHQIPALYEKMLKTAATSPEKFRGIDYLIKTISDDDIVPEDFKKLYETFKKAVKLNG